MKRDLLSTRFEQVFFEEKAYLEPGLTLQQLAARLYTNKTYLSRLVNDTCHTSFPDLVGRLRVDFARQYILAHPGARLDEIARASGFRNLPDFCRVFKRMTGLTPKAWAEQETL